MQNWKLPPLNSRVAKHVECYWFLEKEQDDVGYAHPKLNPDPATHLILAEANQKYQYSQGTSSHEGSGSHWILPHCKTFVMDHSQPFRILCIKFHVGALYALNAPFPPTDLDTILNVDMDNLFKTHSLSLSGLLAKATNEPQKVCTIMDEVLGPLLLDDHEDKHSQIVRSAIPLLTDT